MRQSSTACRSWEPLAEPPIGPTVSVPKRGRHRAPLRRHLRDLPGGIGFPAAPILETQMRSARDFIDGALAFVADLAGQIRGVETVLYVLIQLFGIAPLPGVLGRHLDIQSVILGVESRERPSK